MTVTDRIPLGEYVFLRILQANPKLKSIFGVPGDYNLNLMEYLYKDSVLDKGVTFIGNCNELNAAYCSDGYSRIIDTFAVMITTLGVGELSALNGVSSAFSEFVPVLHIVGSVATGKEKVNNDASIDDFQNWHHLVQSKDPLSKPDCHVFSKMSEPISICTESLTHKGLFNGDNFDKIDNVIKSILRESRPGYLYVPSDLPDILVPASRLEIPFHYKEYDPENIESRYRLNTLSDKILTYLYQAESPIIQSDDLIYKFHAYDSFNGLIDKLKNNKSVRLYASRIGKCIDETLDNFVGIYPSAFPDVADNFQNKTDLLIVFGYTNFETNGLYNGLEHYKNIRDVILINPDYVKINDEVIFIKNQKNGLRNFCLNDLIQNVSDKLDVTKLRQMDNIPKFNRNKVTEYPDNDTQDMRISSNKLFNFANHNLRPNDIILCEVSSFSFDLPNLTLRKNNRL
ncbi:Thiamin diphosphate-binding protein, partial [Yamadazyma tenuis ATCC 10573]